MLRILSALCVLFMAFPAWAAPSSPQLRPVYHADGRLRLCLMKSHYDDQREISIALTPAGELQLAFKIPKGHFVKQRFYDLDIQLDSQKPARVRMTALSDSLLLAKIGTNLSFIENLTKAEQISIGSEAKTVSFPLPPMPPVMAQLQGCSQATQPQQETLPSQVVSVRDPMPVPTPAPSPLPQSGKDYMSSKDSLMAFLRKAGFEDPRPVYLDDVPEAKRVANYVWKTGKILGGVKRQPAPAGVALSQLAGLHLKGLNEKCDGSFHSYIGKEQDTAYGTIRYAGARCTFPEDKDHPPSVVVSLLFILSPENQYTVFTHEGLKEDGQTIRAARDKLGDMLLTNNTSY